MTDAEPKVIYLRTTSTGDYFVVATDRQRPVSVKRTRYDTTVCMTCHTWEGRATVAGEEITGKGCKHTKRVEDAVAAGNFTTVQVTPVSSVTNFDSFTGKLQD